MKILAMDSAAAACSVALLADDQIIAHDFQEMTRGHASELLPMVEAVLENASQSVEEMDAIAVTVGPGGFTGLRIALACARGFGVAAKRPVIGVTTLEALAYGEQDRDRPLLCALDAKRADLYAQYYNVDGTPLSDPVARMPEDIVMMAPKDAEEILVAGDCFARLKPLFEERGITAFETASRLPDAQHIARCAASKGIPNDPNARPSAFYIRPPDAELPKNGGRLRP
ncbi:tRNA (adenosine(37)-N6)-threonylcarbamoyltransferase complex dimerization subunit type 1 TsaB [Terasakiella sp. A23]|uniref:tRNA (adenosine(37)-N6)-threonylcarbamoyltransferase complex dimerization subunit type 1 TsaB n=1 Tax=Terasakiella sp. FCG-A23 TaxID=3080561 RepID=UPI00295457A0|nr:tRNA (adenosine(37)-N6)-threonylcarbamoyltransferase complex dimerization subunit type 1 TsaB [Terasakiella sp. A23]MDV7338118.1 tRNA (adenosine(37)-N6)-threonylcarbamoyltransferase complex dimerization subunit type 1 TsaB [Terasakiella sp. A23]